MIQPAPPTRWSLWTRFVLRAIDDARADLDAGEFEGLLDVLAARIASLYADDLTPPNDEQAAA